MPEYGARSGLRPAGLHHHDRDASSPRPFGGRHEPRTVAQLLDEQAQAARARIVDERVDQLGHLDVGLVAQAHHRPDADPPRLCPVDDDRAHAAAVGEHADDARSEVLREIEGRTTDEAVDHVQHADAVGTKQAGARRSGHVEQARLLLASLIAQLGEAGRADDDYGHADLHALRHRLDDARRGQQHVRRVDRLLDIEDRRVAAMLPDVLVLRIDGEHPAGVAGPVEVRDQPAGMAALAR